MAPARGVAMHPPNRCSVQCAVCSQVYFRDTIHISLTMASSASTWLAFLLPAMVCVLLMMEAVPVARAARAFFVFGDSLVDNGNNNYLFTTARADSWPYGIDTPDHRATGRFSNGKNVPDLISEHLGSEHVLPYLSPELDGDKLLIGANFASAGIGILNDTGIQFENIIRISKQLTYFQQYQHRLATLIGPEQAARVVGSSLTLITLGGNDFVNNYYLVPYSVRSREFSLPDYIKYILSEYKQVLRRIHGLGARRILVTGVGPIGCVPAELALHSIDGRCDPELQRASEAYNPQLEAMLAELNAEVGAGAGGNGAVYVGVNTRRMHADFIDDPRAHGFATATVACCGQGPYNGIGICTMVSSLCADRDQFVFWDAFHPTERANRLIAQQYVSGSTDYISPMNLSTIMLLDAHLHD